jgi:pyruvate formate lyase activating enzyme
MNIAGLVKTSFVDYPGKIVAVIFTQGCNFNCYYCHNRQLIPWDSSETQLDEEKILEFLSQRKNFLEGVAITGGEPTLQEDLSSFLYKLKLLGYSVKLDTNGSHPEVIKNLLHQNLLDYVAMDIKAPQNLYDKICQTKVTLRKIIESIDLLKNSQLPYEFRTTWAPGLTKEDIETILKSIPPASTFYLQKYRKPFLSGEPVPDNHRIAIELAQTYPNCRLRGF